MLTTQLSCSWRQWALLAACMLLNSTCRCCPCTNVPQGAIHVGVGAQARPEGHHLLVEWLGTRLELPTNRETTTYCSPFGHAVGGYDYLDTLLLICGVCLRSLRSLLYAFHSLLVARRALCSLLCSPFSSYWSLPARHCSFWGRPTFCTICTALAQGGDAPYNTTGTQLNKL
jgi:hypothetical protein